MHRPPGLHRTRRFEVECPRAGGLAKAQSAVTFGEMTGYGFASNPLRESSRRVMRKVWGEFACPRLKVAIGWRLLYRAFAMVGLDSKS